MLKKLTKLITILLLCLLLWPAQAKAQEEPEIFPAAAEESLEPSAPTVPTEPEDEEGTDTVSPCSDTHPCGDEP